MKRLYFGFAAAMLAAFAVPAAAQFQSPSYKFIRAVENRDGATATELLQTNPPGLIDFKDAAGNTPLIIAINRQDYNWTGFLINKGADVNLAGKSGDTPLIAASRIGFGDAVDWLIKAGAKVDAANRMGETALIIAVQQRQTALVRTLLRVGANPDKTDSAAGLSARDYAARDTRSRQILQLIEASKPKPGSPAK